MAAADRPAEGPIGGPDDIPVASTPAEVPGQRVENLTVASRSRRHRAAAGRTIECRQRHHDPRRAETALEAVLGTKGGRDPAQRRVRRGQALDRRYLRPVGLDREHQAGPDGGAVDEDGARAADAVLAADMRAGQPEVVAEKVRQQQPRRHARLELAAVDAHMDRDAASHGHAAARPPSAPPAPSRGPLASLNAGRPIAWIRPRGYPASVLPSSRVASAAIARAASAKESSVID